MEKLWLFLPGRLIWMDVQRTPEYALIYYDQNAVQNCILKIGNILAKVAKGKCSVCEWH